jgi:hypothetical protein
MFPSELSAGDVEGLRKLYASEIAKRNGTLSVENKFIRVPRNHSVRARKKL